MKKVMILTLFAMAAVAVQADNKPQVVTASPKAAEKAADAHAVKLSADEQAFVAKLDDRNRHSFCDKFSNEQRHAAMTAVKNGADANEAVAHLDTALELKAGAVANAAAPEAETEAVK